MRNFCVFLGETSNAEKVNNTQSTQAAIGSSTSIDTNKNNSINSDFSSDNTSGSNYTIASRPTLHTNNFIQTSTVLEGIFDQNGQNYYYLNGQKQTNYFLNKDGKVYYFDNDGVMYQNKWYYNWGHSYYFGADGARYTNQFLNQDGKVYYFDNDGVMYQNKWYYN